MNEFISNLETLIMASGCACGFGYWKKSLNAGVFLFILLCLIHCWVRDYRPIANNFINNPNGTVTEIEKRKE